MIKRLFATMLVLGAQASTAADIVINAGDGLNDATPVAPVGDNTGTTLGQQRMQVFQAAADRWEQMIAINTTISVDASFELLACTKTQAVLGAAGPTGAFTDFSGAPLSNTWYPTALAVNLDPTLLSEADGAAIQATFNSNIGNFGCLESLSWYYGMDGNPGPNQIDFFEVILHELGHGLGVLTFTNLASGAKMSGRNDAYMANLLDLTTGKYWPQMTNAERITSAKNNGNLVWAGDEAQRYVNTLVSGANNAYPRMYAPSVLRQGSSVSHFDSAIEHNTELGLASDDLMEPSYTGSAEFLLTTALLHDIGWTVTLDTDDDLVSNPSDAYPLDESESADTDGDQVGDNADAFPEDPTESVDSDSDGYGDNSDPFVNQACLGVNIVVDDNIDSGVGSLRNALIDVCPEGEISFENDQTIQLLSPLEIQQSLTINGLGQNVVLDGTENTGRAITVTADSHAVIRGLEIRNHDNYSQGAAIFSHGELTLDRSVIQNNQTSSDGGAMYVAVGPVTLTNNLILGNRADLGGAVYVASSAESTSLTNNTFYNNLATVSGDAIYSEAELNLRNNIITGGGEEVDCVDSGFANINSNNLIGDGSCFATLSGDPSLYAPEIADYRPIPGSIAIDAGTNTEAPSEDYLGNARPQGGVTDIGALEYNPQGDFDGDGVIDSEDPEPANPGVSELPPEPEPEPEPTPEPTPDPEPVPTPTSETDSGSSSSGGAGSLWIVAVLGLAGWRRRISRK